MIRSKYTILLDILQPARESIPFTDNSVLWLYQKEKLSLTHYNTHHNHIAISDKSIFDAYSQEFESLFFYTETSDEKGELPCF